MESNFGACCATAPATTAQDTSARPMYLHQFSREGSGTIISSQTKIGYRHNNRSGLPPQNLGSRTRGIHIQSASEQSFGNVRKMYQGLAPKVKKNRLFGEDSMAKSTIPSTDGDHWMRPGPFGVAVFPSNRSQSSLRSRFLSEVYSHIKKFPITRERYFSGNPMNLL
jgi:hypothetical protein